MANDIPNCPGILQLDNDSYTLDGDGKVCKRVCGEFATAGLTVGGLTTEVTLNSATWTALPATPLTGRNAMSVQNQSTQNIKINFATPAGFIGVIVAPGGERFYDAASAIVIYGKSTSGSAKVVIEELA